MGLPASLICIWHRENSVGLSGPQTPGASVPHNTVSPDSATVRAGKPGHGGQRGPDVTCGGSQGMSGGRRRSNSWAARLPPSLRLRGGGASHLQLPRKHSACVPKRGNCEHTFQKIYTPRNSSSRVFLTFEGPGLCDGWMPDAGTVAQVRQRTREWDTFPGHLCWGLGARSTFFLHEGLAPGCSLRGSASSWDGAAPGPPQRPSRLRKPGLSSESPFRSRLPHTHISTEPVRFLQLPTCSHVGLFDDAFLAT